MSCFSEEEFSRHVESGVDTYIDLHAQGISQFMQATHCCPTCAKGVFAAIVRKVFATVWVVDIVTKERADEFMKLIAKITNEEAQHCTDAKINKLRAWQKPSDN